MSLACFLLKYIFKCTLSNVVSGGTKYIFVWLTEYFIQLNCHPVDDRAHAYTQLVVSWNGGGLEGRIVTDPPVL